MSCLSVYLSHCACVLNSVRAREAGAASAVVPKGAVVHEGVLRRKKEDHKASSSHAHVAHLHTLLTFKQSQTPAYGSSVGNQGSFED